MRLWILLFLPLLEPALSRDLHPEEIEKKGKLNVETIIDVIDTTAPIISDLIEIWNFLKENFGSENNQVDHSHMEARIISQLYEVNDKVSILSRELPALAQNVTNTILKAFPRIIKLELNFNELSHILDQVEGAYDDLQLYLSHRDNSSFSAVGRGKGRIDINQGLNVSSTFEQYTLERFALWATGPGYDSLPMLLKRLTKLVMENETEIQTGILQLVKDSSQEIQYNVCNLKQSPHQVIFNLYNTVALAELKGNLVLQFAYMLLKVYGKGNFTLEAELAQERYEKNLEKEKKIVQEVLEDADRSIYRCDPKQYVEGVNYERLTRLLQGYIENEVNLNPYGTCSENCNYYEYTDYNGCYKEQFCAHQPECQGKVLECRFVDSDMNICVSTNSDRRYDWIEYENGRVLGTKGICEYKNFFKVDSWWRYLFWHCSYCLCLCDDSRESDRYFSLKDVTSDTQKNKVVTGVKLVKNNHIIHLQIQQGVLGRKGKIDEETVTWKPVDNYTIDDANVESNVDYHMMTWLERSLDLDDVYGPPEHVVTGVRFRKLGTHLNLEIRLSRVNFTSGEVYGPEYSYWKGNDNTDASLDSPRSEIKLNNPDVPIRKGQHQLDSRHDQYVQFQATSYDTDAGQSTVPFIDSQPLTSGGFPLSGIGLIHRGKPGSGGFIAPKLISYNFAPHLQGKK